MSLLCLQIPSKPKCLYFKEGGQCEHLTRCEHFWHFLAKLAKANFGLSSTSCIKEWTIKNNLKY